MPNRSSDTLFQLIRSLKKSEKRNFKLYITRNSSADDLKIIQLFDALDNMEIYDEAQLLKKSKAIAKQQLSNIKAHLYREILSSLRLIKNEDNIDMYLHEQLDFARILYNKGLYLQSLKTLDKVKETALAKNQLTFLPEVLFFEKKIEALHITRSMQDRADQLTGEADLINRRLQMMGNLSNLSLQLYSWYIRNGHARNRVDEEAVQKFFEERVLPGTEGCSGFYERLYLFQSYCWYAFIRQDFLMYYRYAQKWVDLFEKEPFMIEIETDHYIKGMHNLLGAHFDLKNHKKLLETLAQFEEFAVSAVVLHNDNNLIQTFIYLSISRINRHFIEGTFTEGRSLVAGIAEKLDEYQLFIDAHRVLVFYYKFASLYFGSADYATAIDYLTKIIHWKVNLRTDLQCYARLLHLIAHYELENDDLLEYLIKSVYRFMAKMENLGVIEEEIFNFLRHSFHLSPRELKPAFEDLLSKLKTFEKNPLATRAFSYLDIISWLESKVKGVPVQDIIRGKFLLKAGTPIS